MHSACYASDAEEACRIFLGLGFDLVAGSPIEDKPPEESYETEAKMEIPEFGSLRQRLKDIGAEYHSLKSEENFLFDTAGNDLKNSGRLLRLRINDKETNRRKQILTFKGPKVKGAVLKVRPEYEVELSNYSEIEAFLGHLDYGNANQYSKVREKHLLMNSEICLDLLWNNNKTYVEIEGPEDEVWQIKSDLGLGSTPLITASYASIVEEAKK
jgi:predicted adenylyl cyclase CyaB